MGRPAGFFDVEERLAGLSKKGDDLERLAAVVNFELFRPNSSGVCRVPIGDRVGEPGGIPIRHQGPDQGPKIGRNAQGWR